MFTGTFLGSRASFFWTVQGQNKNVHGQICENVHGHFFDVHGEKQNTDMGSRRAIYLRNRGFFLSEATKFPRERYRVSVFLCLSF